MLNKQSEMTDDNRAQTVFVERKPSLEASVLGGFNVSRMELRNEASTDWCEGRGGKKGGGMLVFGA